MKKESKVMMRNYTCTGCYVAADPQKGVKQYKKVFQHKGKVQDKPLCPDCETK